MSQPVARGAFRLCRIQQTVKSDGTAWQSRREGEEEAVGKLGRYAGAVGQHVLDIHQLGGLFCAGGQHLSGSWCTQARVLRRSTRIGRQTVLSEGPGVIREACLVMADG
jgi:hypothetical protein